jgi:cytochrome d ubiquinol oxidase subunit II
VLRTDAHHLFERLLGPGLPFVIVSGAAGGAALLLLRRAAPLVLRALAFVAVASVIVGWGVAQYPYMLGTHLSIAAAAAPHTTLVSVVVVTGMAAVLCVPSLGLLYFLQQRGALEDA